MCLSSVDTGEYLIPSHTDTVYQRSIVMRLDLHLEAKVEKLGVITGSDMTLKKFN